MDKKHVEPEKNNIRLFQILNICFFCITAAMFFFYLITNETRSVFIIIFSIFLAGSVIIAFLNNRYVFSPLRKSIDIIEECKKELGEQQTNLTQANKKLEELRTSFETEETANSTKTAFLENMSRDVRTLLNSVIGFSELAQDSEIPVKTREHLEKIQENAEWLLMIINNIMEFTKIESGKMDIENTAFVLNDVFDYCIKTIKSRADEKGLTLQINTETCAGYELLGDPLKLRQAILNILSNAVNFTDTGTVNLLAKKKESGRKKVKIYFEVKDSGIGINDSEIDLIFKPFMQLDNSITRKNGGLGLGLPITRNIIEMMGGIVNAESVPGAGSKFSFEIDFEVVKEPAAAEPALAAKSPAQAAKLPAHHVSLTEKPHFEGEILICEDSKMNQQVICEHLARVGLKTVMAKNGQEGVDIIAERLRENQKMFDLIFMDIHMPIMDGMEAAEKIIEMGVNTPIVALTANVLPNNVELYKLKGMADFIGKPFKSDVLWKCLLKFLQPV